MTRMTRMMTHGLRPSTRATPEHGNFRILNTEARRTSVTGSARAPNRRLHRLFKSSNPFTLFHLQPCVRFSPSTLVRPVSRSVTPAGSCTVSSTASSPVRLDISSSVRTTVGSLIGVQDLRLPSNSTRLTAAFH